MEMDFKDMSFEDIVLKEYYKERMYRLKLITEDMTWKEFRIIFKFLPKEVLGQLINFCNFHQRSPFDHFKNRSSFYHRTIPKSFQWLTLRRTIGKEQVTRLFIHMWNNLGRICRFDEYEVVTI